MSNRIHGWTSILVGRRQSNTKLYAASLHGTSTLALIRYPQIYPRKGSAAVPRFPCWSGHSDTCRISSRISSTRQAVMRGPSFRTGLGYRPDFTPAHQVDLQTGTKAGIGGTAFRSPMICDRRRYPVSGSIRAMATFSHPPLGARVLARSNVTSLLILLSSFMSGPTHMSGTSQHQPQRRSVRRTTDGN